MLIKYFNRLLEREGCAHLMSRLDQGISTGLFFARSTGLHGAAGPPPSPRPATPRQGASSAVTPPPPAPLPMSSEP